MTGKNLKLMGYFLIIIVITNFFLFAFTVIPWQVFLIILGLAAIFTYLILPKIKQQV